MEMQGRGVGGVGDRATSLGSPGYQVRKNWPSDFCMCCEYQDPNNSQIWFPTFFPKALICPCLIVGENATLIVEEEMMCNNCLCHDVLKLGSKGCCFCFTSLPLCPALPIFSCFVCLLRWRMMEKYNIQEEDWCEAMKGCCFPCALTQQNIFLRELHHNRNKATFSFQSKHAFAPPTQRM